MIKKGIALLLSILLLHNMVLPAYAQAAQSAAMRRMPFEASAIPALPTDAVSRAVEQAQFERYKQVKNLEYEIWERNFGDLSREIDEVVDLLTKDDDNKTNYDYFREAYITQLNESYEKKKAKIDKELKNLDEEYSRLRKREAIADLCEEAENKASCELAYRNLLIEMYETGKAEIQEAKFELDNWYSTQSREQAMQAAYKKVGAKFDKELEKLKEQQDDSNFEAGKAYIQGLGSRIHAQKYTAAVEEVYPLFHSIGALKEADRAWGAQVLRQEIANEKSYCKKVDFKTRFHGAEQEQQGKCNGAISAAGALTIIGKGQEDKDALFDLLKEGHNGIMAPSVIMAAGMGLVALGGANLLAVLITEKAREIPPSWQISLAVLSLEEWGRAFRELEEGGEWLGYNQQASLYQVQKGEKGYRSAWSDLGIYLGLEAKAGNKDAKHAISVIVGEGYHGLVYFGYTSSDWISVKFPAVLEGILASGYQLDDSFLTRDAHDVIDAKGQYEVNPKAKWAGTKQYLDKNHLDLTGYLIKVLYFGGKSDLDPWSRLIIRNELVKAYNEVPNRPKYKGMVSQRAPSQEEINSYQHWQKVLSNLRGVDIVLAIIGVLALGTGLVKGFASGVSGIAKLSKTLKIARAGMGTARGANGFAKMYGRVVRLGTLQKSGTSSYRLYRINQASKVLETQSILPKVPVKNLPVKLSSKMKARASQSIMQATESYQAERAAAQAAAQATTKVPLSATPEVKLAGPAYTGPVKVTHAPQPVTNAMGQTVMQYRPINPEPIIKPSGWNVFKTNLGQKWNWFGVGAEDLGGQFLKAFRSKVAGTALVIGLNTTPFPSTGLSSFVKASNTIRTELVMGRTTKGLTEVTSLSRATTPISELGHVGAGLRTTTPLSLRTPANITKAGLGFNLPFSGSLPYLLPFSLQAIGIDSRAGNWLGIGGGGGFRLSEKDYSRLLLPYDNMPLSSPDKLTPTVQGVVASTVAVTSVNATVGLSQHVTPLVAISLPSTRKAASWVAPLVLTGSMLPQPAWAATSIGNVFSSPAFMIGAGAVGVMGLAASGAFGKEGLIGKPIYKLFNTPYQITPMVSPRGKQHTVWQLNNLVGRPLGYIKYAPSEELERTQQFLDLIKQIDPTSINLLSLQYPSIRAQGIAHLSPRLQRNIRQQANSFLLSKFHKNPVFMDLSSIDTSGQLLMDLEAHPEAFAQALVWQPISLEEWNQVESLFRQLNDLGFQHTDLEANIWFKRLSDGRLQLSILDFEKRSLPKHGTDLQTLQYYKQQLIAHQLLGKSNFFDHPQNRPHYLSQADENLTERVVWEVQNRKHQKVGYLKLTDLREMERTKKFAVLAQQKIPSLDLIEIEYPQILSTGWRYLPAKLHPLLIEEGADKDFVAHNRVGPMIVSSVDVSGFMPSLVATNHAMRVRAKKALRGQPIMMVEWEQLLAFFRYMNQQGFKHGDLTHNLWLRRTEDGILKMTVMDFEEIDDNDPGYNDVQTLQSWQRALRKHGLLQQNAVQNLPTWQQSWLSEEDF